MPTPRYAAKRDKNEKDIFAAIRGYGITVQPIDVPCDALCGINGFTYLVEVKDGPKAPFTAAQKIFRNMWTGNYQVLRTVDEAHDWARGVRRAAKLGMIYRGVIE